MDAKSLFCLNRRVAIVTGGCGRYGAAIVEGLCEMGATVIITARSEQKSAQFASRLRKDGFDAWGLSLDLSSDASIEALCRVTVERFGRIDVLVNNAVSWENHVGVTEATRARLQASSDTNLTGSILLSQTVIAQMQTQEKGSIINIGSMRSLDCPHFPFYPAAMGEQPINYTTEKWAMLGMTKFLAGYYGKNNIRVNCVCPGGYDPALAENPQTKVFVDTYNQNCPLGRFADRDDIKGPVIFLASDASAYVTGSTLVMDGGWTIW